MSQQLRSTYSTLNHFYSFTKLLYSFITAITTKKLMYLNVVFYIHKHSVLCQLYA